MFLYNADKRCIAVDDESARALGYASSGEFLEEAADVARFFINRPGYVYDFRNFSWIDYIIFNPGKKHRVIVPTSLGEIDTEISVRRLRDKEGRDYFAVVLKEIDGLDVNSTFIYDEARSEQYVLEEEAPAAAPSYGTDLERESVALQEPAAAPQPAVEPEESGERGDDLEEMVALYGGGDMLAEEQEAPAGAETLSLHPKDSLDLMEESAESETALSVEPAPIDLVEEEQPQKPLREAPTLEAESEPEISYIRERIEMGLRQELGIPAQEPATEEKKPAESEAAAMEEEAAAEALSEPPRPATQPLPKAAYDLEQVAVELEVDEELIRELVEEFLQQAREVKPQIYEALESHNLQKAKDLIHKIKGAVANLRIRGAEEILAQTSDVTDFVRLRNIIGQFYLYMEDLERLLYERYGIGAPSAGTQELSGEGTQTELSESGEPRTAPKEDAEPRESAPTESLGADEETGPVSLELSGEHEAALQESAEEEVASLEELKSAQPKGFLEPQEAAAVEPHEAEPELDLLADVLEKEKGPEASDARAREEAMEVDGLLQKAASELGISREDVEEFVTDYIFRAINVRPLLERLVKSGSKDELRNVIHKLKGTALNLRLEPLAQTLEEFSAGDEEALEHFYATIEALREKLGVEVTQTIDDEVLERNAMELGIDPKGYRELVDEYMEQLERALERLEREVTPEEVHKLISVGENLRLGLITTLLEGALENSQKRHYFIAQLRELIERYKGAA